MDHQAGLTLLPPASETGSTGSGAALSRTDTRSGLASGISTSFSKEPQRKTEPVTPCGQSQAPYGSLVCTSWICKGTAQRWLRLKRLGAPAVRHLRNYHPFFSALFKRLITHSRWDECNQSDHPSPWPRRGRAAPTKCPVPS